jgi:predicted ABC-type ATPase
MSGVRQQNREITARPDENSVAAPDFQSNEKAVLVVLAGAPGAGKTTFYEDRLKSVFPLVLKASSSPLEQAETEHERRRIQKEEHSFVYQDLTVDPKLIDGARKAGYEVSIIYLGTEDPSLNIGRILVRVAQGGPFAALGRIAEDFTRGTKQLPDLKGLANELMLFDNTTNGRGARLIAHFHEGDLVKLARSVPRWAQKAFGKEFGRWRSSQEAHHGKGR